MRPQRPRRYNTIKTINKCIDIIQELRAAQEKLAEAGFQAREAKRKMKMKKLMTVQEDRFSYEGGRGGGRGGRGGRGGGGGGRGGRGGGGRGGGRGGKRGGAKGGKGGQKSSFISEIRRK